MLVVHEAFPDVGL